jgi:Flp pilus assembly protein TadG
MAVRPVTTRTRSEEIWADEGGATVYIVGLVIALFAVTALVFDAGQGIATKADIRNVAAEAARTGASEIDLAHWRSTGETLLDPAAAEAAALDYLSDAGHAGTAEATTASITVTVETTWDPVMLDVIGQSTWTVSATQTAEPNSGTLAAQEAPS